MSRPLYNTTCYSYFLFINQLETLICNTESINLHRNLKQSNPNINLNNLTIKGYNTIKPSHKQYITMHVHNAITIY